LSIFYGQNSLLARTFKLAPQIIPLSLRNGVAEGRRVIYNHFLDCNGTNSALADLEWIKDNNKILPPSVRIGIYALELDLFQPDSGDEGVYTCRDYRTGNNVSIIITGGKKNLSLYELI